MVAFCGEPRYEFVRTPPSLLNPQVIAEVLSPSTEAYDRGDKFLAYQRIDSLTDYLLVSVGRMRVEHFTPSAVRRLELPSVHPTHRPASPRQRRVRNPPRRNYDKVAFPAL